MINIGLKGVSQARDLAVSARSPEAPAPTPMAAKKTGPMQHADANNAEISEPAVENLFFILLFLT